MIPARGCGGDRVPKRVGVVEPRECPSRVRRGTRTGWDEHHDGRNGVVQTVHRQPGLHTVGGGLVSEMANAVVG